MKVNELNNLYIGWNPIVEFKVLISASDINEAQEIANQYLADTHMAAYFDISEFCNINTNFNCDYLLTKSQSNDSKEVKISKEVNVEKLINTFSDMAKRNSLLARENVTQEDLLVQIIGTIVKVAMEE